jgi:anti-sigma B factor antagonist
MTHLKRSRIGDQLETSTVLIAIRGDLDIAASIELRNMLFTPTALSGARLVVDLTDVTFMDTSGIGALVAARRWAVSHQVDFALTCPEGPALRTIRTVGLDKVFNVRPAQDGDSETGALEPPAPS